MSTTLAIHPANASEQLPETQNSATEIATEIEPQSEPKIVLCATHQHTSTDDMQVDFIWEAFDGVLEARSIRITLQMCKDMDFGGFEDVMLGDERICEKYYPTEPKHLEDYEIVAIIRQYVEKHEANMFNETLYEAIGSETFTFEVRTKETEASLSASVCEVEVSRHCTVTAHFFKEPTRDGKWKMNVTSVLHEGIDVYKFIAFFAPENQCKMLDFLERKAWEEFESNHNI
jgi:hypothetical protein